MEHEAGRAFERTRDPQGGIPVALADGLAGMAESEVPRGSSLLLQMVHGRDMRSALELLLEDRGCLSRMLYARITKAAENIFRNTMHNEAIPWTPYIPIR